MSRIIDKHKGMLVRPKKSEEKVAFVTHHAAERLADWRRAGKKISIKEAYRLLALAALRGKKVGTRPGKAYEVCWEGLYAVVTRRLNGTLVVLTFNGDHEWRRWHRKQHVQARRGPKALAAL